MTFPTRQQWFDSVWPNAPSEHCERILVPIHRHTNTEEVRKAVEDNPDKIYMLLIEDFLQFSNEQMPDRWRRMPPDGIPPNVWMGASVKTQEDVDSRLPRLRKIRARKLFVLIQRGYTSPIQNLGEQLINWRCSNCGRRGEGERPEKCPSGTICMDYGKIDPQIHGVFSMEIKSTFYHDVCTKYGVSFWDGRFVEVPE